MQTMVFSKKMGAALNDVPLFGTAFNNWFPIVVLFWCGALFLNVWQAIAKVLLPSRYQFQESGGSEHLERGQVLVRKEQACLPDRPERLQSAHDHKYSLHCQAPLCVQLYSMHSIAFVTTHYVTVVRSCCVHTHTAYVRAKQHVEKQHCMLACCSSWQSLCLQLDSCTDMPSCRWHPLLAGADRSLQKKQWLC